MYHFANRSRSERRNQLVLNVARPDVAEWLLATIDGLGDRQPEFPDRAAAAAELPVPRRDGGSLGIGGDLPTWSAAELAEAAELVAVYKEVRPVIQQGLLYRLDGGSAPHVGPALSAGGRLATDDALRASEYILGDQVVVLAWWGPQQRGIGLPRLRFAGLDPAGHYRDVATGTEYTGGFLMHNGIRLPPDTDYSYGSALLRLTAS